MSRNFDLMQEMETVRARPLKETVPDLRGSGEELNYRPPMQPVSDGAQSLVQRIFLLQMQAPPRVVVFAGIDHGNGCSETAASVAGSLTASGRGSVCLVEANFRSPVLPARMGVTNHHGLTDALLTEGAIRSFAKPVTADGLWLLSSGALAEDSPRLLGSERLKMRFSELREEFDFVIIDAPPVARYPDALALGQISDGLVLVLEADSTRREAALSAMENLRSSKVPVLAAVLNKRTFPIPEAIYSRL